ncbi:Phosphatidylinositol 3- and 4-kinase, putative [Leishmania lindenbergi]|uniref:Phosphatidylinositol 3- and 4-kinase n=1 Tax=Leishmania lindenbergi TaxID=651832 RepID=A0AAW3ABN9_9TRYP
MFVPSKATVTLTSKDEEPGTVAAVQPSITASLPVTASLKEVREELRWRQVEVADDVCVQQQRARSVSSSPLTLPHLFLPNRGAVTLGNCTPRRVAGSGEGGASTTVTPINVIECVGPAGNCKDSGLPHSSYSSREVGLLSFVESGEDDRDDRGSNWDRIGAFDITMPATLRPSTCRTTAGLTTDRTRGSNRGSSPYAHARYVLQEQEKGSSGADTAATPEAGMTPLSPVSLSVSSYDLPSVVGCFPAVLRCRSSPARQRSCKCLHHADLSCADCGRCTGLLMYTNTLTITPSTGLLSPYTTYFEDHRVVPVSDTSGDRSLCLCPRRYLGDSSCSPHEFWTMAPRLRGVNEVLLQRASASDEPQLFHQALAAFQLWDALLRLELHGNSAGGTYMVRLAELSPPVSSSPSPLPSSSSVAVTSSTTNGGSSGAVVAVFKPCDEEIGQESNPHANRESDRTETFAPGSGSRREVLAYRLDHGHNAGVPPTLEVMSVYWTEVGARAASWAEGNGAATTNGSLHGHRTDEMDWQGSGVADGDSSVARTTAFTRPKIGSLQLFVPGCEEAADILPGHFDVDEVHALAIFDIRTLNGDRHGGNVLVHNYRNRCDGRRPSMACLPRCSSLGSTAESDGAASSPFVSSIVTRLSPEVPATFTTAKVGVPHLIPIDHSYICPSGYADPDYEWLSWPQAKKPFSARNLAYIAALDAVADAELVRSALLAEDAVRTYDMLTSRASAGYHDVGVEEVRNDAAASPAHAMPSAWSSSSSSTVSFQALHVGSRERVSASVTYDRDAAKAAAEVMQCTTRLLQIAALEFHMTAYEIGTLCRRPRIAQASLLEEVLEKARDELTWEPVWSRFDDVVRQRLACRNGPG